MLNKLKELNPDIRFYDVTDPAFLRYGRVITDFDPSDMMQAALTVPNPEKGCAYRASLEVLEKAASADALRAVYGGGCDTQIGYCWGHNSMFNATEWHNCSEINVAVKPLVLILGHRGDIRDGKIAASDFEAFYLPAGSVVEVYSSTLHYCPCEVNADGFGALVVLASGTNTARPADSTDKLLCAKNKWLLCHEQNAAAIARGQVAGITGINYKIAY